MSSHGVIGECLDGSRTDITDMLMLYLYPGASYVVMYTPEFLKLVLAEPASLPSLPPASQHHRFFQRAYGLEN
jgi:hypothetical protein